MRRVADSFTWPFRAGRAAVWVPGLVCVLLLPILFIPLLGYTIAAVRAAEAEPSKGPPAWHLSARLLADGFWTALAIIASLLPFALLLIPLATALHGIAHGEPNAHVFALLVLALPWGLLALLLFPHVTAKFAASGSPRDMFDAAAAVRGVRVDFVTWNVAAAAIVTAWAIGVACVGLLCVGIVPGVFYAILVSAHAAAALHRPGKSPAAG